MKHEEREREMREIHVEGERHGEVTDNLFRDGGEAEFPSFCRSSFF